MMVINSAHAIMDWAPCNDMSSYQIATAAQCPFCCKGLHGVLFSQHQHHQSVNKQPYCQQVKTATWRTCGRLPTTPAALATALGCAAFNPAHNVGGARGTKQSSEVTSSTQAGDTTAPEQSSCSIQYVQYTVDPPVHPCSQPPPQNHHETHATQPPQALSKIKVDQLSAPSHCPHQLIRCLSDLLLTLAAATAVAAVPLLPKPAARPIPPAREGVMHPDWAWCCCWWPSTMSHCATFRRSWLIKAALTSAAAAAAAA